MQTKHQQGIVIAFSGVVTVMLSLIIAQQNVPLNISADLLVTRNTMMNSSLMNNTMLNEPTDALADADPNEVVITVTDELGNEVITYTEAELNELVYQAGMNTDDGETVLVNTASSFGDDTVEISTNTCQAQTAKIGKIFTASAGKKGTKTYSYCKEDTPKGIFADHMDKAVIAFCSNFNANKYTKDCADGCMQVAGVQGATGSFYEKVRKYNITQVEDKTCKPVTGNSVAFTGNAYVSGDCTFIRQCEPFKSKFRDY